jgi:NDP-sugar pyrophosphorylase family protein
MSKIQAIILAGGVGSRLRPYTAVIPKPLMPIGDYPIAEVIIGQLKRAGLTHIAVSTGHLAGLIQAYFGNGNKWGVRIEYISEDKPLGTAGAIRLVHNLETSVLVINGDVLTDLNFTKLMREHRKRKALATIAVKERTVKNDFGVIMTNQEGDLVDYIEKPEYRSLVSIGIYVINDKCVKHIKPNEALGMPELMMRLKRGQAKVYCHKTTAIWLDLGRPDDFRNAQAVFEENREKFLKG